MVRSCPPRELKAMLQDVKELALVDVREQGVYYHGHLLFASCIPLSRLEMMVGDLVPRRGTRVVLCDGGNEGLAERAAEKLTAYDYSDVSVMQGGVNAWRDAGYEVFTGINVVSKAFGEYIEHRYDTPRLSAEELAAKRSAGEKMVILDSRPMAEFENMSIPGGIDCPGAELVYRVFDVAPDPDTLIVVNCAGRTRSIIGAQSLINAGIPNQVMALKNGTMGWELAGFQAARGRTERAAAPSPRGLSKGRAAASRVAERFGVLTIDQLRLEAFRREREQRSLVVLDVRTAEEFSAGHRPGSRHAPGGQLVQATDEYIAIRNARIVLVDDDGVRATMTASWLKQMGWDDAFVLQDGLRGALEQGAVPPTLIDFKRAATTSAAELKAQLNDGSNVAVLDFATSLQYRKQHIPGAYWAVRSRLDQALAAVSPSKELVLSSPDGLLAHYIARDVATSHRGISVEVLEGGTSAWRDAGFPTATGAERLTCEANDVWYKPYEQTSAVRKAMQDYLSWEVDLVKQIERDGDAMFK